jgi:uncharacterized protein (DUF983 family)
MAFFQKLSGLVGQRCPRCLQGRLYRRGLEMHVRCPQCDLLYEREPGYFIGAMYISYGMATMLIGLLMWLLHLALPEWDLGWIVLLATALFLPLGPMVSRYARTIWMYFDHWAWPGKPGLTEPSAPTKNASEREP